ncbi:prolipoprotein diacylglyceryl transferase [Candidatus Poriferisodalis sp.]|uniref:prolipoprotein diacylglyceryl transferase n=1 Tax=Candidatus Poriferisodalis sp. TaxID=3101277 RepID=UPI003B020D46
MAAVSLSSVAGALASIPSPSRGSVSLGPLDIRAYGVGIGLSVLVAMWITSRRWRRAIAHRDDAYRARANDLVGTIAVWAVPSGLIGARLYHVITDFDRYQDNLGDAVKIWQGGLGIWGGISVGVLVAVWLLRRGGHSTGAMLDALAPALAVAQAIGRLGNWFNQELYGRPTDLPWGLEIDEAHRVDGYGLEETFHPTFAYEALWNLCLAATLVWVVPKVMPQLRTGYLFAMYVLGYTAGRLWIELLRIDAANELWGVRINVWTSTAVGLAAATAMLVGLRRGPHEAAEASDSDPAAPDADTGLGDPATTSAETDG